MKGTLNKPSFRRLFFSIQIPSLKSTYSVLEAIVNEDFLHRLHIYRYPGPVDKVKKKYLLYGKIYVIILP